MQDIYQELTAWIYASSIVFKWVSFIFFIVLGWVLNKIASKLLDGVEKTGRMPAPVLSILRPSVATVIWFIMIAQALSLIGVNITSILGAAGVLGMAIGFASQTALSNVISGLFIISEKKVKIGDYISVGEDAGSVESIKLLAVWLRKVDNSLVRIPNSTLIQSPMTNITGDELRRCDFAIGVDYGSDLLKVREVLMTVIKQQPLLATDPEPVLLFSGFGESSLDLHLGAWCKTSDYHHVRFLFASAILEAFAKEGINIPYPCRTLFTQSTGCDAAQQ